MPQSLSKVYVHIVFSTKNRVNRLNETNETSMYEYLGGICKGLECNPLRIGGYKNHVHILCLLSRKITQMKLVEELKKESSRWFKTKHKGYADFYWQNGYGIFSVDPSGINRVIRYIENQHKHHSRKSFQDEYRDCLKKNDMEFDERYVWD